MSWRYDYRLTWLLSIGGDNYGGEIIMRHSIAGFNDHNHYLGEELHDDGYLGPGVVTCAGCVRKGSPEGATKCDSCGQYFCPDCDDTLDVVDGIWMCEGCKKDYRIDHPDWEELVAEAEYREYR